MSKKNIIVMLAAIVLGLLVAFFAWLKVDNTYTAEIEIKALVPAYDISPYSKIQDSDLKVRVLKENEVDNNTVLEIGQLRDMTSTVMLYADKPIDKRNLSPAINAGNKRIIGVLIDTTRLSNATAGDYVDVFWLNEKIEATTALPPAIPLSSRAQIISIDDGSVTKSSPGQKVSSDNKVKSVYLLVNPEEAPYIIHGSMKNNIALSKVLNPKAAQEAEVAQQAAAQEAAAKEKKNVR